MLIDTAVVLPGHWQVYVVNEVRDRIDSLDAATAGLTAEGAQHSVALFGQSECIDRIVADYLTDLQTPPDGARCTLQPPAPNRARQREARRGTRHLRVPRRHTVSCSGTG
ncbi:alpha/beta hydrolase [Pseudonocardia alaniniphila]|uniref:Alpha/beta hydrolase n=1 Tax=Pseudonocardia alaniniphila TaxID=75291 RepID=A0ABS9TTL4_9PSEU|nr:alpha/beta hydrolase [Pseudonocardia alaniniphila]MCH6171899.1 alpha/beta hydrolase [Pseudonocardia alaniniphila]